MIGVHGKKMLRQPIDFLSLTAYLNVTCRRLSLGDHKGRPYDPFVFFVFFVDFIFSFSPFTAYLYPPAFP